jgi:hypothetical protein
MFETKESTTRSPVLGALLLVGAAAGIGALVLPYGFTYFMIAGWADGNGAALGAGLLLFAVVTALLVGAASLVPDASHLTRTMGGRVGWALIVTVAGTITWMLALSAYFEDATMAMPFSAVPYALVAGLLLRQWYFKVVAMALVVALGVGLHTAPTATPAEPNELDARLAAANLDRGQVFVAHIPGYHRVPQQWAMAPDDPQSVPPDRHLTLYAYPDDPTGDCQPHPNDTTFVDSPCTVERPGLTYTVGVTSHQYFHRKGTLLLRTVGTLAVDRDILRDAALTARPATEPGIYTTDIDGYEASLTGPPPSMLFLPKDKTQVPLAKHVEVYASPVPEAGTCAAFQNSGAPSPYLECVAESPDLHYQRMADKHLYFAQHGAMEVRVTGGLGVDRNLLRDAAVNARLATDDELMTILPPAPRPLR